jgi:heptose I phosphotransferase
MHELYLRDDLARAWAGREPFATAEALTGEVYRAVARRRTLRFALAGRWYFAKVHRGVGVLELLKNWLVLRRPVVDAANEYRACLHLAECGIVVPTVAGFGRRGINPATRSSFLVTDALTARESLEDLAARWVVAPPSPRLKRQMIAAVAELARRMHDAGVNHRDFYLCHLLADTRALEQGRIELAVIDLHRAQLRRATPKRWLLRDLAALDFSSRSLDLTRGDRLRFIASYTGEPVRDALRKQRTLWTRVRRRADRLQRKGRGGD